MTDFDQRISAFPAIKATYDTAVSASRECRLKGDELDFFLSRNCRAWFFEHHLKVEREAADQEIRSIDESPLVPFELSPVQLRLLDSFEARIADGRKFSHRVMKCRRAKVSTIYLAIGYHLVRFNENKKGLVFCDRLETSRKLRRILEIFFMSDDLASKPSIGKRTLGEGMYFHDSAIDKNITDRDSFILLGSGEQKNPGLAGSLDWLIWSEAALTPDALTHWTTISPSMQGALFDVAESTPCLTGQDEIIFPAFEKQRDRTDTFFIPWMDIPEYRIDDEALAANFVPYIDHHLYGKEVEILATYQPNVHQMLWRRFKLDELGNADAFRQVFPISQEEAFYCSAGLVFHKEIIQMAFPKEERLKGRRHALSDNVVGVSAVADETGVWTIWQNSFINYRYIVTADTAEGKTADKEGRDPDYCLAMAFSMTSPIEECAFMRERMPPEVFAEQVAAIAKYYNDALVVPERNAAGLAMIVRLIQIYTNVYRSQKMSGASFLTSSEYGFQTSSVTKVAAITSLMALIKNKNHGLLLHTESIKMEMSKFIKDGVEYHAARGYHDDAITNLWLMAEAIFRTPSLLTPLDSRGLLGKPRLISKKIERNDEWNYANS